jgi:3-oxoadipate enol-lactonase
MFVRVNGITMHLQVRGEVGAPPVLLLHSLGTALQLWDGVAELLATRYRPVQIDLRGHGLTSVPRGSYTIDDMAADVVGALEAMDIAEAHIVGASLGGAVAQRLGVIMRGRVRSLMLLGTAMSFPPRAVWLDRATAVRSAGIEQFVESSVARWVSVASLGTPAADGLRAMLRRTDPEGYAASAEALATVNLAEDAGSLDLPTLVMVGEADHSTPIGTATGLRDAISGARPKHCLALHTCLLPRPRRWLRRPLSNFSIACLDKRQALTERIRWHLKKTCMALPTMLVARSSAWLTKRAASRSLPIGWRR